MSEVDIRTDRKVTSIRFSDNTISSTTVANHLAVSEEHGRVEIRDNCFCYETDAGYVVIANAEHARNLIKALDFAIDLGLLK